MTPQNFMTDKHPAAFPNRQTKLKAGDNPDGPSRKPIEGYENEPDNRAQRRLERAGRQIEQLATSHPLVCLGAAAVVGIALGWWVKRK